MPDSLEKHNRLNKELTRNVLIDQHNLIKRHLARSGQYDELLSALQSEPVFTLLLLLMFFTR